MSKTDGIQLNVMGYRLDDDPVPVLYLGPTKNFVEKVIEPRINSLVNNSKTLSAKVFKKKQPKLQKDIAGVKLRLAWAHSATEIAGDPAGVVFLDERDRMPDDVAGEGDPKELADARHSTYPDGKTIVTSTPKAGAVDSKYDDSTGLEHWQVSKDLQSPTWQLWQEGTRHEWAWPCPHCNEYFIPRFKLLRWPESSSAQEALRHSCIVCPKCGTEVDDSHKTEMNMRGVFIAPGQSVKALSDCVEITNDNGEVRQINYHNYISPSWTGDNLSFWVSGLCSPWRTYGQRARAFIDAVASGESERIQAVMNTAFGELYRTSGEAPEISQVYSHKANYKTGEVNSDVVMVLLSVDVQQDRLVCVLRGWGIDRRSWLIEARDIIGATDTRVPWDQLEKYKTELYNDIPVKRCFIDSGYRSSEVYSFCWKHKGWAYPTKGHDSQDKPVKTSKIDVEVSGKLRENALNLWHLDANFFKTFVHDRINQEPEISNWHLPADITEDYCKQLIAEAKVTKPNGATLWVRINRENHYLDCEAMNSAAAYSLGLFRIAAKVPEEKVKEITESINKPEPVKEPEKRKPLARPRPPRRGFAHRW